MHKIILARKFGENSKKRSILHLQEWRRLSRYLSTFLKHHLQGKHKRHHDVTKTFTGMYKHAMTSIFVTVPESSMQNNKNHKAMRLQHVNSLVNI